MIILSAGLPKSGSAWYFRMTNDVVRAAGFHDVNEVKEQFFLHTILKFDTCNIQEPTPEKLQLLTAPPIKEYTFTVKTHFPPNSTLLDYMALGRIKATFIYRDPRDMVVSGYEAGENLRQRGIKDRFAKLTSIKNAIYWAEKWLKKSWEKWKPVEGLLFVRYEDLLENSTKELKKLCEFMDFHAETETLDRISARWGAGKMKSEPQKMVHFNKGCAERFRTVMSPEDLELCSERLGSYIVDMGYTV